MKKSIFLSSFFLMGLFLVIQSCKKVSTNKSEIALEENMDVKAGGGGCSAACTWSSCSISNCAGIATCTCVNVGWFGWMGSASVCNCSAGAVKKIRLNDQQILNHGILVSQLNIMTGDKILRAKRASLAFVQEFQNDSDDETLNKQLNEFIDAMNDLSESEARTIADALNANRDFVFQP